VCCKGAGYAMNAYRHAIKKVAILDFDVHHGNGTEVRPALAVGSFSLRAGLPVGMFKLACSLL
jgi:hypothetical protein